jgi:hypothetical protein
MKPVRISALFLLVGITAAYEQAVRTQVTYNSDIKCPQSFCNAFFEDESICEFSGTHALVYERDGECGIEINDSEVTCSVLCNEAVVIADEMKRGGVIGASGESTIYTPSLKTDIAVALLAIGIVLCVVWQWLLCRARIEGQKIDRSVKSIASAYSFISIVNVATDSIEQDEDRVALNAAAISIEDTQQKPKPWSLMREERLSDGFQGEPPLYPRKVERLSSAFQRAWEDADPDEEGIE